MDHRLLRTLAIAGMAAFAGVPAAGAAKHRAAADLAVARVGGAPASLAAGGDLRVAFTVRNGGAKRAKASKAGFMLSVDARRDAADVPLGSARVKALGRRRSARGSAALRVPGNVQPGTYRLLACADLAGRIRERNERNNCRAAAAGITVLAGAQSEPPSRPGSDTAQLPPPPTGPGTDPSQGSDPVPPDPAAVAPDLPETTAVSTLDANKFLFTGANPVQRGVAKGTISEARILVVRGRVLDRAGAPIEGVRVTVLDHRELGRTQTRADGRYDLAVNGGTLTLVFEAAGFLTAQREGDRSGRATTPSPTSSWCRSTAWSRASPRTRARRSRWRSAASAATPTGRVAACCCSRRACRGR